MRYFEKEASPSLNGLKKALAINKILRNNTVSLKDRKLAQKLYNKGVKLDLSIGKLYGESK